MSEPRPAPEIVAYYTGTANERSRLSDLHGIELLRTQEIIRRNLPPGRLRILDVGGGPGVHATWLSSEGHNVHLLDLVPLHVEQAREAAAALMDSATSNPSPFTAALGDARKLPEPGASFDVTLLLGPLYHLPERTDRLMAWAEAKRVTKPAGLIFAAAISRFASLFDGLATGSLLDTEFRATVEGNLRTGKHENPDNREPSFTTAYFHRPDELRAEAEEAGLQVREVVGIEGLAGWLPQLQGPLDDPATKEAALFAARAVEAEPSLLGLSAHLLLVADV